MSCYFLFQGLSFPSLGDVLDPGIESASLISPTLAGRFFTAGTTWESLKVPGCLSKLFLPEAMMICEGQERLPGSQVLSSQEECGIHDIFPDFQNTC